MNKVEWKNFKDQVSEGLHLVVKKKEMGQSKEAEIATMALRDFYKKIANTIEALELSIEVLNSYAEIKSDWISIKAKVALAEMGVILDKK